MGEDPVAVLIREMDAYGVAQALLPVSPDDPVSVRALRQHPDRLLGSFMVDPIRGMETVPALESAVHEPRRRRGAVLPLRMRASGADR